MTMNNLPSDCYATSNDPPTTNESLGWPSCFDGQIGTEYDASIIDANIYLDIYDLLGFAIKIQNAINEYGFVWVCNDSEKYRVTHVACAINGTIIGGKQDNAQWFDLTGYAVRIPSNNRILLGSIPKMGDWRNK